MRFSKYFLNIGRPKTAFYPSEMSQTLVTSKGSKKRLMTSCDVSLFAQPSLPIRILCFLESGDLSYCNERCSEVLK